MLFDRFFEKFIIAQCAVLCLMFSIPASAWEYSSQSSTYTHSMQIRVGAAFHKKWNNGIHLSLDEDLRSDVYNTTDGPSFRTSHTTLTFAYSPIEYVKFDAGYTLKITNKKNALPDKLLRHRVFMSVSGIYRTTYAKLSLRERFLMEARTDSINPLEKNRYNWQLRSRISSEFYVPGKSVKPYIWCELINTLNAPEYQQRNGRQFISQVRTQAGVKWRITRLSSLNFYYRFTYSYERNINITKKKGLIELEEETLFQHAFGVAYDLNW